MGQSIHQLRPEVVTLLKAGVDVIGVDLFQQGEFLTTGEAANKTRRVKNPREAAAYTFGYNRSVFSQRTHDVLTALRFARTKGKGGQPVGIVALGSTGPIAAAARAIIPESFGVLALESGDFRFLQLTDLHDPSFQPAIARYGDLPGLLELCKPSPVRLIGGSSKIEGAASLNNASDAVLWLKDELVRTVTH
ncbi:MAG: hypothetical protein EOP84_31185 [Verrucomicrobiaceae bacterium]|nr:MAG: hypothetical protein EOP84_31185 [Verrucomicrobiaceae bacterium]